MTQHLVITTMANLEVIPNVDEATPKQIEALGDRWVPGMTKADASVMIGCLPATAKQMYAMKKAGVQNTLGMTRDDANRCLTNIKSLTGTHPPPAVDVVPAATDKQKRFLDDLKVTYAPDISIVDASKLIRDKTARRRK